VGKREKSLEDKDKWDRWFWSKFRKNKVVFSDTTPYLRTLWFSVFTYYKPPISTLMLSCFFFLVYKVISLNFLSQNRSGLTNVVNDDHLGQRVCLKLVILKFLNLHNTGM